MPTRNVNLTDYYDDMISRFMESGRYSNASEVIRAGLRLLEHQTLAEEAKLEALRSAFLEGQAAYESGNATALESEADIDRLFDALDAETGPAT